MEIEVIAAKGDSGKRLDVFLMEQCSLHELDLSRTGIQSLIKDGSVVVEGLLKPKPNHRIKGEEKIRLVIPQKKSLVLEPEDIALEIIYSDRDIAVVDKPCGMVVHPAPGNRSHTLVNALLNRFDSLSSINPQRPGIVHRLDKDTSGVMVVALNNKAHHKLARQFAQHTIKRRYYAIVSGRVEFSENVVEAPINRHPTKRESMSVSFTKGSRYALTRYRTIGRYGSYSLLELEPHTGRTHQLRVHLAYIGHPILGDRKYGKDTAFPRLALHAAYLGIDHPATQQFMEFSSKLPREFELLINKT